MSLFKANQKVFLYGAIAIAGFAYFTIHRANTEKTTAMIRAITPSNGKCRGSGIRMRLPCTRFHAEVDVLLKDGSKREAKLVVAEIQGENQLPTAGVPAVGTNVVVFYDPADPSKVETDISRPNRIYWVIGGAIVAFFYFRMRRERSA